MVSIPFCQFQIQQFYTIPFDQFQLQFDKNVSIPISIGFMLSLYDLHTQKEIDFIRFIPSIFRFFYHFGEAESAQTPELCSPY